MVLKQLEQLVVAHAEPEVLSSIVGTRPNSIFDGTCAGDCLPGVAKSDLKQCPRLPMESKCLGFAGQNVVC